MRILRRLAEDGLEYLGTLSLTRSVVVGDPGSFGAPAGSEGWFGAAVQPGTWHLFGRVYEADDELLEELVMVHEGGLEGFYDQYDELGHVAKVDLPHHRLVVVAGEHQGDVALLRSLTEPEEYPWVADDVAIVLASIGELPGQVATSPQAPLTMLSVGLSRVPFAPAGTHVAPRE